MPKQHGRGRSTSWIGNHLPTQDFADLVSNTDAIRAVLPRAIEQAEAAGLSIIASYLGKALMLAERIAASSRED